MCHVAILVSDLALRVVTVRLCMRVISASLTTSGGQRLGIQIKLNSISLIDKHLEII